MSMSGAAAAAGQRQAASTIGLLNLRLGARPRGISAAVGGGTYKQQCNLLGGQSRKEIHIPSQWTRECSGRSRTGTSISLLWAPSFYAYLQHQDWTGSFLRRVGIVVRFVRQGFPDQFTRPLSHAGVFVPELDVGKHRELLRAGKNALGATVLWDLNKVMLKFGYDHLNYVSVASSSGQPNAVSEVGPCPPATRPRRACWRGWNWGGDLIDYAGKNLLYRNARQWNVGGFYDTQVSELSISQHTPDTRFILRNQAWALTYYGTDSSRNVCRARLESPA